MKRTRGRKRGLFVITAALSATALLIAAGAASATGALDANNPGPATGSSSIAAASFCGPGCNPATNAQYAAQTFTALSTGVLDTVQVQVWRNEDADPNVLGDLEIRIEGTGFGLTAGLPDDSNVLATETVPVNSVSTAANTAITVVFDPPAPVEVGTQYAIVLAPEGGSIGPGGSDNVYIVGTTGDNYSGGTLCLGGGTAEGWTPARCGGIVSEDAVFATYVVSPPPIVGLSASSLSFGDVPVGSTSSPQTVTITNTAASGSQSLVVGPLSKSGANTGDFVLSDDQCSSTSVAAGDSCTVDVSFAPGSTGPRSATLVVPSNAATSPDHVALSGNATAVADVALSMVGPGSAKRGTQVTYNITVTNSGPSTAHNVVLRNPVPAGAASVGASASQGKCTIKKATVTCSLGDLAKSGSAGGTVTVKINAKVGSTVNNIASAYSTANGAPATFDPDTSNNWKSLNTTVTS